VKHRVVGIAAKRVFYGPQVWRMGIRRDLWLADDPRSAILHEGMGRVSTPVANVVGHAKLCVRVNSRPRPHIAPTKLRLLWRDVLLLSPHELPYLIALQAADSHIANIRIVVVGAGIADLRKEFEHGIEGYIAHPRCSAKRVTLNQSGNDTSAVRCTQTIHASIMHDPLKHVNRLID
jgi:hypothetical protein